MANRDHFSPMEAFSSHNQPDEGYSEEPINPPVHHDLPSIFEAMKSSSDVSSWLATNAGTLPEHIRKDLAMALLQGMTTETVHDIVQKLNPRLNINFIQQLPAEITLKILCHLDPVSLVRVLQTCRTWHDVGSDRQVWENIYFQEGWKANYSEIEAWEEKVNTSRDHSVGHLHRIQGAEGHTNKVRIVDRKEDEDYDMLDSDRYPSIGRQDSSSTSASNEAAWMDLDGSAFRAGSGSGSRHRRKELTNLPAALPPQDPGILLRSTLWVWDPNSDRYRINWKYLYRMRRRLEANWEDGDYTTFALPHPDHPREGHDECIYTLQFDSRWVVSGSRDQTVRIWDLRTRRLVRPPLLGHTGSVLCLQFDSDPEEDLLVTGSSDSNIFIWKFSTGELIQKITKAHAESVLNVRFDKRIMVTCSKDRGIKIFNRKPLRYGDVGYKHNEAVVDPIAKNLRRYGYEPDLAQELPVKPAFTVIARLDGHTAAVNAIQVRGDTIVSVSGDRHIKVWNWPQEACIKTIPAHDKGIACVEFDGRRIVSGSSDNDVCIFDAPTGAKVAVLRAHTHLVRTLQAGFADLPGSVEEDAATARVVDRDFLRALHAGEIEPEAMSSRRGRRGRVNAGSYDPSELQSFGAKIPPGGGGGRRYGRIVSGSYDHCIIIWRRDKKGIWKPNRTLRQEEAFSTARREPASSAIPSLTGPSILGNLPGSPSTHLNMSQVLPPGRMHQNIIDTVVPMGAEALQESLAYRPGLLAQHTQLQDVISRQPSAFQRAQLRHVVTNAILTTSNSFAMQADLLSAMQPMMVPRVANVGSSVASIAGSAATSEPTPQDPVITEPPQSIGQDPSTQPAAAATAAAVPPRLDRNHPNPHVAAEHTQARVFRLQFDARRIICSTQTTVIVGWDFCNGDAQLDEVSPLFATVD